MATQEERQALEAFLAKLHVRAPHATLAELDVLADLTRAIRRYLDISAKPDPLTARIAGLEAAHAGQRQFIAKQAAMVRALQRRLNRHGIDSSIPAAAERDAADAEATA